MMEKTVELSSQEATKEMLLTPHTNLISIVIPVYNEKDNLIPLHAELVSVISKFDRPYELILIDDGSTDGSFEILKEIHDQDPYVCIIQFRRNFGQTAAFAAGFEKARGNVIVTLDADGQNDPKDIPRLLNKLESGEYDMVIGWRKDRKESSMRRLISNIANYIISRSSHIVVHDRGCSLKIFDSELAKNMHLYGQQHRFLPEIASSVGAKVTEIPVNDRTRRSGKSKYGPISRTPRVILDLITVVYLLTYFSSPMRLFGSLAFITGALGVVIGGTLALTKIYNGVIGGWEAFHAYQIGNRPLLLLAILLVVVAIQFLMMGLLGEMVMRTYYEAQNKKPYLIRQVLDKDLSSFSEDSNPISE